MSHSGGKNQMPGVLELCHLCGRHVDREVAQFPLAAGLERVRMLMLQRCQVQRVGLGTYV